jgi:hypothetical protein
VSAGLRRRFTIAALLAVVLFVAAISNEVYEATSPAWLSWHVLLRKAYSIVAFGTLAALAAPLWPDRRAVWRLPVLLAVYSAAIELGQWLHGGREGLGYNAFDVGCGAAGGLLGAYAARWFRPRTQRRTSP